MKTAIRIDDVCAEMDLEKFNRVKKILDDNGLIPLIGVIPFNEDPSLMAAPAMEDFPLFLFNLRNRGWIIALHGYNHVYTTQNGGLFPLNKFSEFAGVYYEKQAAMIKKGKNRLEEWGVPTGIFMAPGHTYDNHTLDVLWRAGFDVVTDGFGKMPYIRKDLKFMPISKKRSDCISDKYGFTTLVLHPATMNEQDFVNLENSIRNNREHFISYKEFLEEPWEERTFLGNWIEYLTATAKRIVVKIRN